MSAILAFVYSLDIYPGKAYFFAICFFFFSFLTTFLRLSRLGLLIPPCIRCSELAFDFFFSSPGRLCLLHSDLIDIGLC